jgi:crossover junction endodeoxyribonuclease RusA
MTGLRVVVNGKPAPQGSKRIGRYGGMFEMSKGLTPWREAVRSETQQATTAAAWPGCTGPVRIDVVFYLPRPKGHYGTGRNGGIVKPSAPVYPCNRRTGDIDKLVRAVLDGLKEGGAMADDSLAVELTGICKRWADGHPPGAVINLEPM